MLGSILSPNRATMSQSEWMLFQSLTIEQMKLRLSMRFSQFSKPIPLERLNQLMEGAGEPVIFDYQQAINMINSETAVVASNEPHY